VDESSLIARAVSGDAAAERELYDAHVDRIYRLAFRLTGDGDAARDITQDTFIRAFSRLGSSAGTRRSARGSTRSPSPSG
jgi:RNA polymerase sigma-70 factor (ECF subfamily)